jgi:NADP-reducing hydrogenase subunit HndB
MARLTIDDLAKIRDRSRRQTSLREGAGRVKITVHMGTCGIAAGARDIMTAVLKEVETQNLHDVIVTNSGCAGLCSQEPMMTVETAAAPAPVKYVLMTPEKVRVIVENHLKRGEVVREYALAVGSERTR